MTDTLALFFPNSAETHDVIVRVAVNFLPDQSAPDQARWFWSYHVRIENGGDAPIQLLARHWRITDGRGQVYEVQGQGVVGETPVILPGGSYDYVSGCPLDTPSGRMSGHYQFAMEDGTIFAATIPEFLLSAPTGA